MASWIFQFSQPYSEADESVFNTIVTTHGVAVASWLLDIHCEKIDQASHGLTHYIRSWINNPGGLQIAWDISFGRAHQALKEGKLDPVEAAVRIGIRISEFGFQGKWHAQIPISTIKFSDRVLESVENIIVDNEFKEDFKITFQLTTGTKVEMHRNGVNSAWSGGNENILEHVGRSNSICLLPRNALPSEDRVGDIFMECQPVVTITPEMAQSFHDGFQILEQNAPDYIPWVERVLSGIVVCPKQVQFRLVSGSWEDVPGYVHMSSPHQGIDIAEILVHECAHQYFYMLQRIGPVDDSSDLELYWSPPIRKKRPLSRILMAYHALANVQLLYEAVRLNENNDPKIIDYVIANESDLQAAIKALDSPLRGNPALTKLGRELYEPLFERIAMIEPTINRH